ncbi:GFA family protein [Aquicoccus sp. SCR17]|nr:GFA family protein [Carideicomes alvinocaridis]
MSETRIGRCLCGEVRIETDALSDELTACHCLLCTRWGGGVQFGIEAEAARVHVTGPVKTHRSSKLAERAWCDTCGSHLWFRYVEGPDEGYFELCPGIFDNAGDATLTLVNYADQAPDGWSLGGTPRRITKDEYERTHAFLSEGETP